MITQRIFSPTPQQQSALDDIDKKIRLLQTIPGDVGSISPKDKPMWLELIDERDRVMREVQPRPLISGEVF